MDIRKISEEERETFILLTRYAFSDWSEEEVPPERLAFARPENVWGAFVDGVMASALLCFPADQNVRGVVKLMGGVAAVATAPQYRNRGHARALMHAAFDDMRERGMAVSMLRPFRESFYGRFGYVTANATMKVTFPTDALRRHLSYAPPAGWELATAPAREALAAIREFWRRKAVPHYHGLIDFLDTSDDEWRYWVKDRMVALAAADGDRRGLALFKKTGFGHHGKLEVSQFLWTEADARDLLLQHLARHRDQIADVEVQLPFGEPFQHWLQDVGRPLSVTVFHLPWMVRVVDATAALDGLPAAAAGEVKLQLVDEQCDWNAGVYLLAGDGGKLRAERVGGEAGMRMDVKALSALVYGTLGPEELGRRGWLSGADASTLELLGRWFPPRVLFNTLDF
jgi:predicted acetyltransferase